MSHRHSPEIEQELGVLAGSEVKVSFTPHLLPRDTGHPQHDLRKPRKTLCTAELIDLYT
ncbi:MAG: hypothetical protein MZV70_34545 [Desulfobacterales bacterium]|nr:hypothetical protein [Desulfobacterales bacterium]